MNGKSIMRRARHRFLVIVSTTFIVPVVFAQAPPVRGDGDLDVTMRVIVDPNAKVPDEIVRRIPLPKPQPATSGTPPQSDKPAEPGTKDNGNAAKPGETGREFGQETAEQARQRAEEARRNKKEKPPHKPPGPPNPPPRGPG